MNIEEFKKDIIGLSIKDANALTKEYYASEKLPKGMVGTCQYISNRVIVSVVNDVITEVIKVG